jgi:hypothetical protein
MGHLAAQPAADAAFDHRGDRVAPQRIGIGFHRQRWTARQPDTGMIAGAQLIVDAIARLHHPLAALEFLGVLDADAALPRQHALAVGNDHFEAAFGAADRFFQRRRHLADAVAVHGAQPVYAERTKRLFDADPGRRTVAMRPARRQILLAGCRGVAVLHDHQHAVALVEHIRGDAGDQAIVPKAAVAHDRDRALFHVGSDGGGARQRQAVAKNGIAKRERRESREGMAADIGADMDRPELALRQFDRGKNRTLRTTGAEIRRPRRNVAERRQRSGAMREDLFDLARNGLRIEAGRLCRRNEGGNAAQQHLGRVIAACRQAIFAMDAGISAGAAQDDIDLLLDVVGRALLHDQNRAFAGAEFPHLFRHQRISDVEHIDRNARGAVEVAKVQSRQSDVTAARSG